MVYRENAAPKAKVKAKVTERRALGEAERIALYLWVPLGVVAVLWVGSMILWCIVLVFNREPTPEPCRDRITRPGQGGWDTCPHESQTIEKVGDDTFICRCHKAE